MLFFEKLQLSMSLFSSYQNSNAGTNAKFLIPLDYPELQINTCNYAREQPRPERELDNASVTNFISEKFAVCKEQNCFSI